MEEIKKLLISFLSKLHGMDEAAVTDLVFDQDGNAKPDALNVLMTKETDRVKKLKGKTPDPKVLADALKAERDKTISEITDHVKAILPDYSSEKEGLEFFDDLANIQKVPASKEITDDDVKRSKVYRDMLAQKGDELKRKNLEWETKYNQRDSEIKKAQTLEVIHSEALKEFKALNPVLPEDQAKAERQIKKLFLDELTADGLDYQVEKSTDGKTRIIILKDGKPYEDELGHLVEFKSHIHKIAEGGFLFAASDPKGAGGDPSKTPGGQGSGGAGADAKSKKFLSYKLTKPSSDDDWMKRQAEIELDSELKPKEKAELIQNLQNLHTGKAAVA